MPFMVIIIGALRGSIPTSLDYPGYLANTKLPLSLLFPNSSFMLSSEMPTLRTGSKFGPNYLNNRKAVSVICSSDVK